MSGQFSANQQFLGYLYQARYALLMLIERGEADPTCRMSIERFDDVSFDQGNEPVHQIQTKHHLNAAPSLGDSSPDLWKTLRVWCTPLLDGRVPTQSTTHTIVTTARAADDSIASKLRPKQLGGRSAEAACTRLRDVATTSLSQANKSAYEAFLRLPAKLQSNLVKTIYVLDSAPTILDARMKIRQRLMLGTTAKNLDGLCERLEGWWFEQVVRHLICNSLEPIQYTDLWNKVNEIREQFQPDNLPVDFPKPIDAIEDDIQPHERLFIEQLRLISVKHNRRQRAMSDYLRASKQRSQWLRESLVRRDELEQYESTLIDEWAREFDVMCDVCESDLSEESMQREGRQLFYQIDGATIPIRSRCTQQYISRGSYHMLANRLKVGWHLDFEDRLRSSMGEGSLAIERAPEVSP